MFKSVYYSVAEGTQKVFIDNIEDNDIKKIKENLQNVKLFLSLADYYLIVRDNCLEFLSDSKTNGINKPKNFIRADRLLLNSLSVFYVWQEYSKKNSINTVHKDIIANIKKRKDILGLADKIRHQVTHNGVDIIEKIDFDKSAKKTRYLIDINSIFQGKAEDILSKKIIKYLNGTQLEAVSFMEDFLMEFNLLTKSIWEKVENEYQVMIKFLMNYIPRLPPDCYNSVIVSDNTEERIAIGRMMELLTGKYELIFECECI